MQNWPTSPTCGRRCRSTGSFSGQQEHHDGVSLLECQGSFGVFPKGFGYYLKQLAIKPQRANGRLGVHSLRKTVIQALQASRLSGERRRAFVGHERGDADVHEADYMRPWSAEELASLFPGLKWAEWLDLAGVRRLLTRS